MVVISSAEVSNLKLIKQVLDSHEADIKDFEISMSKENEKVNLCFDLRIDDNIEEELVAAIAKIKGVISASWFNKQEEVN